MWYKGGYASWQRCILSRRTRHGVTYASKIYIHAVMRL
jgi:hypothetical protein